MLSGGISDLEHLRGVRPLWRGAPNSRALALPVVRGGLAMAEGGGHPNPAAHDLSHKVVSFRRPHTGVSPKLRTRPATVLHGEVTSSHCHSNQPDDFDKIPAGPLHVSAPVVRLNSGLNQ